MKVKICTLIMLLVLSNEAYPQCNTSDFSALKDFYNNTLTVDWSHGQSGTWDIIKNNATPPLNCTFQGIYGITSETIGGEERVTGISFQYNRFTGVLVSSIGNLTELKTLVLAETKTVYPIAFLHGTLPIELLNLTKLTNINLSNNGLSGSVPDFGSLPSLTNLNISGNFFQFGELETNFTSNQTISSFAYQSQSFKDNFWNERAPIGGNATLIANVSGTNNQYIWTKNGSVVNGETNATLVISNVQESQFAEDKYKAVVTSSSIPGLTMTTPDIIILEDGVNCHPADFAALKDLYNSAGGTSWFNNSPTSWNIIKENATPPANCTFYGIVYLTSEKIAGAERITSFVHDAWGINGYIPPSIGNMEHLEVFQIKNTNSVRSPKIAAIPSEINDLANLKKLILFDLEIEGAIPSLSGLVSLEELDLSNNKLEGSIPVSLGSLANVKIINLWNNQLTGTIPSNFTSLSSLQTLSIFENNISGTVPDLSTLPLLESFSISQNRFQFGDFETKLNDFNNAFTFNYKPQKKVSPNEYLRTNTGGNLTLEAIVSGGQNNYQWYFEGSPLSGETNSTLVLTNIQASQFEKPYHCEITSDIVTTLTLQTGDKTLLKNGVNCSAVDFAALKAFYDAAQGGNWLNKTGWEIIAENATPPANCTFTGIYGTTKAEVNNEERIVSLDLQGNNLRGTLNPSLGDLSELATLHMDGNYVGSSYNRLTGSIPGSLGDLVHLTSVKLSNLGLSGCFDYNLKKLCGQLTTAEFYNYQLDANWENFCSSNAGVCSGTLPPCAESAVLVSMADDVSSGQTNIDVKNSTGFIEASNKITGTAKATFSAGRYIYLKPGFIANSGTVFLAQNGGCD